MTGKTSHIIEQIYREDMFTDDFNIAQRAWISLTKKIKNIFPPDADRYLSHARKLILLGIVGCSFFIFGGIFYYNQFYVKYQDMLAAESKIHTFLQKRRNVQLNISKIVFNYSQHESSVFKGVVASRQAFATDGMASLVDKLKDAKQIPDGASLEGFMSKIFALSEQYPDLKLNTNLLKFIDVILAVEKNVADARVEFNLCLNSYSTVLKTFPGNVYNLFFGFKSKPYYRAAENARDFKIITY
ncbi:MAG: LemA family protein [Bacteriovoracaceae bacterium]|nr:LemA family protein [Bacteriovoracaceae bacterium]